MSSDLAVHVTVQTSINNSPKQRSKASHCSQEERRDRDSLDLCDCSTHTILQNAVADELEGSNI